MITRERGSRGRKWSEGKGNEKFIPAGARADEGCKPSPWQWLGAGVTAAALPQAQGVGAVTAAGGPYSTRPSERGKLLLKSSFTLKKHSSRPN